ncbi:MAG TPA: hypothetical protein VFD33_06935, partial [Bacillota bacterium]|nr:hypothetical protein [Bacillota bacterium]
LDPIGGWSEILERVKVDRIAIYTLLADAKPKLAGNRLQLLFPHMQGFYASAIEKEDNRAYLEGLIKKITGRDIRLKCQVGETSMMEADSLEDDNYIVEKAIEIFGEESVEIIEEK